MFFTFMVFATSGAHSITLDSVIAFSDSCVTIEWTPDSNNTNPAWYLQYGTLCTGADSIYKRCDFLPGRLYDGVAYSYGGEDSWFLFRNRVTAGFLVGSHQCHYNLFGDPSNKITGTDCSGFLSFAWKVPRVSTTVFYTSSSYITVPLNEVKAGDALIKASAEYGYHAILIVEAEDLKEVVVSEASPSALGCRERLVDLTSSVWSPYKAIRHPGLTNSQQKRAPAPLFVSTNEPIVTLKNNTIFAIFLQPFTGIITGFSLDGKRLFEKQITRSENAVALSKITPAYNIIIISLKSSDLQMPLRRTIVLQ